MASRSLGTLTIDLVAKTFGFEQGMDRTSRAFEKRVKELERTAKQFGTAIGSALVVGVTAAGAALTKITADAIEYADQLDELSNRLGISTEQLSAWGYAAKLTGTDLDSLASAIPKLSKNLATALDEGSRQAELFDALGISVTDAAGKLRDVEDVLPEIADRFAGLDDDTTEAALAMELFGKSGTELLEFLNQGSAGLDDFAKRAKDLGIVVGEETAQAAGEFNDKLDDLKALATGLGLQIAERLLPTMVDLVDRFADLVREGSAADKVVGGIEFVIDDVSTAFDQFNHLLQTATDLFGGLKDIAASTLQVLGGFATFDWEQVQKGIEGRGLGLARLSRSTMTFEEYQAQKPAPAKRLVPGVDEIGFSQGALLGPGEKPWTGDTDRRLKNYFRNADAAKSATKATKELTEAEKAWQDVMEVNALIDEQVQDYRSQQIQDAYELEKAREDAVKRVDEQIADMQAEYDLLGKTNRERAQEIALRYAGAAATEEQRKKIAERAGAIYDENEALDRQVGALDAVRDSGKGFFDDLKDGVAPLDALSNALDRLIDKLYDLSTDWIIDQLLGQQGGTGTGSAGGWLEAFAGLFGGGKASGGWTRPNTMYEVNERGMEMATVRGRDYLLTGSSPVKITPNNRLGVTSQGGPMQVEVNIENNTGSQMESNASDVKFDGERLIVNIVAKAIGSGKLDSSAQQAWGLQRRGFSRG